MTLMANGLKPLRWFSLKDVYKRQVQGFLPIWGLWGKETYTMIGNHGVSVIAEAYRKGFRGFDAERALSLIHIFPP